jgi:predicted transcriptional regulator
MLKEYCCYLYSKLYSGMSSNLFMNSSVLVIMSNVSASDIIKAISEEKTLALFDSIGTPGSDSEDLIKNAQLSRKQYYSRMSQLMKAGLIHRKKGKYYLTSLGKVTHDFYTSIQHAVNNYWKLKAIDSFEMSSDEISKDERVDLINALVGNDDKIKTILVDTS